MERTMKKSEGRKPGSGGARPGAGRKANPAGKSRQFTVTIKADEWDDLCYLREKGVDVNRIIGREIRRLATAMELAELGIV